MKTLFYRIVAFLVVLPAISICDEDITKASINPSPNTATDNDDKHHPQANDEYNDEFEYSNEINSPWTFYRQLRAPSGFSAVRGKKAYETEDDWGLDDDDGTFSKRAPSQEFFGMRGKKFYELKRDPSLFLGARGKKSYDDFQAQLYNDLLSERERIANIVNDYYMDEKDKRKPSGFVGLRGKKSVDNDDYLYSEKRGPMGFQGVRGKKSEFPNFIRSEEKRVPVTSFFGMRGKKQPLAYQTSSFFGVRKKPYLPYTKFVGVRGKKAQDGNIKRLVLTPEELDQNQMLRPSSRVSSDAQQDKRLGFIGMRG